MRGNPGSRAGAPCAALLAALMLAPLAAPAGAAPADAVCPAPYGTPLEEGTHHFLGNDTGPDTGLVDTLRMPGAQRSPAWVFPFAGRLTLVAEVKVDNPPAFTWGILVRSYSNATGWDTDPVWASSLDPTVAYPVGFHVRPSPVVWNGSLYIAWTGEGSPAGGPTDRLVLVRRVAPDGSMDPWIVGSDTDPTRANQHPTLLPAGDRMVLAYSAGEGEADPAATHVAVRVFDGSSFTPSEVIATPPPGWSDELPSLAWDSQAGLFAIWTRTNTTGLGALLMFAQRNASGWGEPFEVAPLGQASDANPAASFYGGKLYVAYSTDDPSEVVGTDSDVKWRTYDPADGSWTDAQSVNPQPSGGSDSAPALSVVGDDLYVGWSSSDDFYAHGDDPDPLYRVYNGTALGPTVEMVRPDDTAFDGAPRFFQLGGVTYAHFMWTPPVEPGAPRGDSREAVRVVDRPPAWFDTLSGRYAFDAVSENGSAHLTLEAVGPLPPGARLVARLPDGSLYPLARDGSRFTAWAPIEPARPAFEVLACGAPIALTNVGTTSDVPATDLTPYLAVAAVGALAVVAYVVARGRAPRPKG